MPVLMPETPFYSSDCLATAALYYTVSNKPTQRYMMFMTSKGAKLVRGPLMRADKGLDHVSRVHFPLSEDVH